MINKIKKMEFENSFDDNCLRFFEMLKKVLPLRIDEFYMGLLKKTDEYIESLKKIPSYESVFVNLKNDINLINVEIESLLLKKEEVIKKINLKKYLIDQFENLQNDTVSTQMKIEVYDLWDESEAIDKKITYLKNEIEKIKEEIRIQFNAFKSDDNEKDNIMKELNDLFSYTNLDEYNVDNCKILLKDLSKIKDLDLSEKNKDYLEKTFALFLQIRIEAYKLLKKILPSIIEGNRDNSISYDYKLIIYILSVFDINKMYLDIISSNYEELDFQLNLLTVIKNYLKGTLEKTVEIDGLNNFGNPDYSKLVWHLYFMPEKKKSISRK